MTPLHTLTDQPRTYLVLDAAGDVFDTADHAGTASVVAAGLRRLGEGEPSVVLRDSERGRAAARAAA